MTEEPLRLDETTVGSDPFAFFAGWLADAETSEPNDPNAVSLATVDEVGMPDVRVVLMKNFDERGFAFYTNFESAKGRQILAAGTAAMCFHWKSRRRQVRLRGPVETVTEAEADTYYASRARVSRLGAWASQQSRPLDGRDRLVAEVERYGEKFGEGEIPRPPYWSGFRLMPLSIEFWQDGEFRLHDRVVFRRPALDAPWQIGRLYP